VLPTIGIPRFELAESASLFGRLGKPVAAERPRPMESVGQSYGYILYRHHLDRARKGTLQITEVCDYAVVYQGDRRIGALDRRLGQNRLEVDLTSEYPLDILVENTGRVNFGPRLVDDRKGITEKVTLDSDELKGWAIYPLPLADPARSVWPAKPAGGPKLYRGTFQLSAPGDTFLDMRGWGKGAAWVNGQNLGRYWSVGPQRSLFVPAPWLRKGANDVIVLDLEEGGARSLQAGPYPV
jgi:beta-galactosidase